jgi:hypothetical protein
MFCISSRKHLKAQARDLINKQITITALPTPGRGSLYDDSETSGSGMNRSDIQDEILFDEMVLNRMALKWVWVGLKTPIGF